MGPLPPAFADFSITPSLRLCASVAMSRGVPQVQTTALERSRKARGEADFANLEAIMREMEAQNLQRPRVFYRREPEAQPLVVAKPEAKPQ